MYPSQALITHRKRISKRKEYEDNLFLIFDTLKRGLQKISDPALVQMLIFELNVIKEYIWEVNYLKEFNLTQKGGYSKMKRTTDLTRKMTL